MSEIGQSVTLDVNRAGGFAVSHIFDLDGPTPFHVRSTVLASNADSEPVGPSPGSIVFDTEAILVSSDGITWATNGPVGQWMHDDPYTIDADALFERIGLTPRYVKVKNARIIDGSSFDVYAGANNPSVQVRYDIVYASPGPDFDDDFNDDFDVDPEATQSLPANGSAPGLVMRETFASYSDYADFTAKLATNDTPWLPDGFGDGYTNNTTSALFKTRFGHRAFGIQSQDAGSATASLASTGVGYLDLWFREVVAFKRGVLDDLDSIPDGNGVYYGLAPNGVMVDGVHVDGIDDYYGVTVDKVSGDNYQVTIGGVDFTAGSTIPIAKAVIAAWANRFVDFRLRVTGVLVDGVIASMRWRWYDGTALLADFTDADPAIAAGGYTKTAAGLVLDLGNNNESLLRKNPDVVLVEVYDASANDNPWAAGGDDGTVLGQYGSLRDRGAPRIAITVML